MQSVSPLWQHNCSSDFRLKVRSSGMAIILSAELSSGFIAPKINNEGIVHPDSKREKKNGGNKVKQQRTVRQNYVFVTASKRGQKYRDYFDPNNAVQLRVMGMEETVVRVYMSTAGRSHALGPSLLAVEPRWRCEQSSTLSTHIIHYRIAHRNLLLASHKGARHWEK